MASVFPVGQEAKEEREREESLEQTPKAMEKGAIQERVKRFIQGSGEGGQNAGELADPRLE